MYDNGVITIDGGVDEGVGEYIPGAGWLGAYVAYEDENGSVVPVTFEKQ